MNSKDFYGKPMVFGKDEGCSDESLLKMKEHIDQLEKMEPVSICPPQDSYEGVLLEQTRIYNLRVLELLAAYHAITRNELRAEFNLPPMPGGDEVL